MSYYPIFVADAFVILSDLDLAGFTKPWKPGSDLNSHLNGLVVTTAPVITIIKLDKNQLNDSSVEDTCCSD